MTCRPALWINSTLGLFFLFLFAVLVLVFVCSVSRGENVGAFFLHSYLGVVVRVCRARRSVPRPALTQVACLVPGDPGGARRAGGRVGVGVVESVFICLYLVPAPPSVHGASRAKVERLIRINYSCCLIHQTECCQPT